MVVRSLPWVGDLLHGLLLPGLNLYAFFVSQHFIRVDSNSRGGQIHDFRDTIKPWLFEKQLAQMSRYIRDTSQPYVTNLSSTISEGVETAGHALHLPRMVPEEKNVLVINDPSNISFSSSKGSQQASEVQIEEEEQMEEQLEPAPIKPTNTFRHKFRSMVIKLGDLFTFTKDEKDPTAKE